MTGKLLTTAIFTFLVLLPSVATSQEPAVSPTGTSDFNSAKLEQIGKDITEKMEAGKIVGCSALIFKDNKIAFHQVWGKRSREQNLPVEEDTIWRIYSMTKPITSVAIMQLVEQGKIKLDEPAATYLPEFANLKVFRKGEDPAECDRPMTVRDLLRHTSGLTYGFFGNSETDQAYRKSGVLSKDETLEDTISKLGKIPLQYQPGTRWHYSVSTDVLGRIVEVASDMSFKDYLTKNIFEPLEMNDTFFSVPQDKQFRFAEMYRFNNDKELMPAPARSSSKFLNETKFYSGGGGLCSTTADYLQFAKMLLNEGELDGKRIIKAETHQEMIRDQLPQGAATRGFKFGLGFRIDDQGHYSWGGAAGTRFWVDPKNKMITVFMIQINPYKGGHGKQFKKLAYDALNALTSDDEK